MEIERKFLVRQLPADLSSFQCLRIEQAYLCTNPVIRIRPTREKDYWQEKNTIFPLPRKPTSI